MQKSPFSSVSKRLSTFKWPAPLDRMPPAERNLSLALVVSLVFHAILLSIHFGLPDALNRVTEKGLDVILVNKKSAKAPSDAQAKAQVNSDGGGNVAEDVRASTPFPAISNAQDVSESIKSAQQRAASLEAERQTLLASAKRKDVAIKDLTKSDKKSKTQNDLSGLDLADSAVSSIAKLEGEIARSQSVLNKHPMRKVISIRTKEVPEATYVTAVLEKIERVGELNFPSDKRSIYGKVLVTLVINPDGSLFSFEMDVPSENKILNSQAKKIAEFAAPFPKIPANVLEKSQVVAITRWWVFTNEDFKTTATK